jgi:hypothetical protein
VKNCQDDGVIKLKGNFSVKLTKDCEIVPTACAETKGFKTAMVHYEVFKNNLPVLKGDINGCEEVEKAKPMIKNMIKMFGIPEKCPVTEV